MKTLICLMALVTTLTANAQNTEAFQDYDTGLFPIRGFFTKTVGWSFQPLTDVSVTALGSFDYLVTDQEPIAVGLWTADGTLLASSTITSGSTLVNQSRYEPIPVVQLSLDQTYFVGAYLLSGQYMNFYAIDPQDGAGSATMAPEIQLGAAAMSSASSFTFPDSIEGPSGSALLAPNFEFQPVPEPSAFWLVGAGSLALLATRRRCRV
jgi:hypothetical protein